MPAGPVCLVISELDRPEDSLTSSQTRILDLADNRWPQSLTSRVVNAIELVPPSIGDASYEAALALQRAAWSAVGPRLACGALDGASLWSMIELSLFERIWLAVRLIMTVDALRQDLTGPVQVVASELDEAVLAIVLDRMARNGMAAAGRTLTGRSRRPPAREDCAVPASSAVLDRIDRSEFPREPSGGAVRVSAPGGPVRVVTLNAVWSRRHDATGARSLRVRMRRVSGGERDVGFGLRVSRREAVVLVGKDVVRIGDATIPHATTTMTEYWLDATEDGGFTIALNGVIACSVPAHVTEAPDEAWWGHLQKSGADTESEWAAVTLMDRATSMTDARPRVVVVLDAGEIQVRDRGAHGLSVYHQYLEGVMESLERRGLGSSTLVIARGAPRFGGLDLSEVTGWRVIQLDDLVTASDRLAVADASDQLAAAADVARRVYEHDGTSLGRVVLPAIEALASHAAARAAEYAAMRRFFRAVGANVAVSHSLDGHFRTVALAAAAEAVPTVAVVIGFTRQAHRAQFLARSHRGRAHVTAIGVWGDRQRRAMVAAQPELSGAVHVIGRSRTDTYLPMRLGRAPSRRVLLVGALRSTNGAPIVTRAELASLIREIHRACSDASIIVKPWLGDDMSAIEEVIAGVESEVELIHPGRPLHNADLLHTVSVVVGEPTSMLTEAAAAGCSVLLHDSGCSRYYYGSDAHDALRGVGLTVHDATSAAAGVCRALGSAIPPDAALLEDVIGPLDGRSADRAVELITAVAGRS